MSLVQFTWSIQTRFYTINDLYYYTYLVVFFCTTIVHTIDNDALVATRFW